MENLHAIQRRIKSVENTSQITKSMKMVSVSKLRHTQDAVQSMRSYAAQLEELMCLAGAPREKENDPFLRPNPDSGPVCYVLILGNRGLCGSYHHELLRYMGTLLEKDGQKQMLVVCGQWGGDSLPHAGFAPDRVFPVSDIPKPQEAEALSAFLQNLYLEEKVSRVVLVYQEYHSIMQQLPAAKQLLPLRLPQEQGDERLLLFEPDRETVRRRLTSLLITGTVYETLLEARTGEHAARMTAMTAASENTEKLIGDLTLRYNQARQAAITTEISEIVGGAAALS